MPHLSSDYGIEDMTSENNSEIEKHLAIRKTQGFDFIILPGYTIPESSITTIMVPLKNSNHKNPQTISSKQLRKHRKSRSV